MFSSRGTVRYEERGQGYRGVEKVGKHCSRGWIKKIETSVWLVGILTEIWTLDLVIRNVGAYSTATFVYSVQISTVVIPRYVFVVCNRGNL